MTIDHTRVVNHFLAIHEDLGGNWNTDASPERSRRWWINDDVYINGVMMTIDADYYMGYLVEVCEHERPEVVENGLVVSDTFVRWVAIAVFHGRHPDGTYDHTSGWYPAEPQSFFERNVTQRDVATWAAAWIYDAFDAYMADRR